MELLVEKLAKSLHMYDNKDRTIIAGDFEARIFGPED